MFKDRNNIRYSSHAHARMPGIFEGDAILKNFSITGCCIEATTRINITLHEIYVIDIIPEKASKVKKFSVSAEARWLRMVDYSCSAGFYIAASPKGKFFQYFVDYISYLSAHHNPDDASEGPLGSRNEL